MRNKTSQDYDISYAPPTLVKDEPHRILDTLGCVQNQVIDSEDIGDVSIVGTSTEIKACDVGEAPDEDFCFCHRVIGGA